MNRMNHSQPRPDMSLAKSRFRNFCIRNEVAGLWIVSLAVFMLGIWRQPFINFETRFAVFAQEMLRHGPSLFPTTYGQPYPDYPVTSTLFIWLISLPFGEVTKFAAVLPTAVASAIVIAMTYKLFADYSKKWALFAVAFEFLTVTFLAESRSISVDQMLSVVTVSAFYLTHRSYRDNSALPTWQLMLLLVAGFLIRGPIGVVIPAGVVLSHLLLTSDRKAVLSFALYSGGVLVICVATLVGLAAIVHGVDFVKEVARMQALGRFAESTPSPKYYYFVSSLGNYALSYPLAVMAALALLVARWTKTDRFGSGQQVRLAYLLVAWIAIILVGLSVPETKKVRYILPAVPAFAGLAAYLFVASDRPVMKWIRRGVALMLFSLPFLAAIFPVVEKKRLSGYGIDITVSTSVFVVLAFASTAIVVWRKRRKLESLGTVMAVAVLTVVYLQIAIVEPIDLRIHDTSRFVREVEAMRAQQPGTLAFYQENPDGAPIKYLVNVDADLLPLFIDEPSNLDSIRYPIWLLTREKNIDDLKRAGVDTESATYRGR
ncbi:MAG: glycosyltransferase family 39 protein, partial [Propionivibrio sp.]